MRQVCGPFLGRRLLQLHRQIHEAAQVPVYIARGSVEGLNSVAEFPTVHAEHDDYAVDVEQVARLVEEIECVGRLAAVKLDRRESQASCRLPRSLRVTTL